MSMPIAAGTLASPGMSIISPHTATMNPAPPETYASLTLSSHPVGAPFSFGLSLMDAWVFAMQTGRLPSPLASKFSMAFFAAAEKLTPDAP